MIEIQVRLRCERCDGSTPVSMFIEGTDAMRCEVPIDWVEEVREKRRGNMITETRMHFCPACAKEMAEWSR